MHRRHHPKSTNKVEHNSSSNGGYSSNGNNNSVVLEGDSLSSSNNDIAKGRFRNIFLALAVGVVVVVVVLYMALSSERKDVTQRSEALVKKERNPSNPSGKCGIWSAQSTIPGGGWGMYAGRYFEAEEELLPTGDIVIPITDLVLFHGEDFNFLWDEYTWSASGQGMSHEGFEDVNSASTGFGAAVNNYFDLGNVDEGYPKHDALVDHPGWGAYTPYHNRNATAISIIEAGQELYTDYGTGWFKGKPQMKFVPFPGDMAKAQTLMKNMERKYNMNVSEMVKQTDAMIRVLEEDDDGKKKDKDKDKKKRRVRSHTATNNPRVVGALPKTAEEYEMALQKGLKNFRLEQTMHSLEWLEEHGTCVDNIRVGPSNIPHAGRGAFAVRELPQNAIVAPMPLIHLPNRTLMEEYELTDSGPPYQVKDVSKTKSYQLLLNYCFGHPESTLLLSPYGYATGLINHASNEAANVRLQWGNPKTTSHQPEWLQKNMEDLDKQNSAVLSFELVATKDINEGDEILLDYGNDWDNAWKKHTQQWNARRNNKDGDQYYLETSQSYNNNTELLRAVLHNEKSLPSHLQLMGYYIFQKTDKWKKYYRRWGDDFADLILGDSISYVCEITKFSQDPKSSEDFRYWARYPEDNETLVQVPLAAFTVTEKPHYHDEYYFRHDIRIPDDLMPDVWRNKNVQI